MVSAKAVQSDTILLFKRLQGVWETRPACNHCMRTGSNVNVVDLDV